MTMFRFGSAFFGLGALALLANGCGQELDVELPQNEAQENAPAGIIFLGPEDSLPPDFTIQALTTAEQTTMLNAVNAVRIKAKTCGGVAYPAAAALSLNTKLITASEGHAADMAAKNYFAHNSQNGTTFSQRITKAGYVWTAAGENIAAGQATTTAAINGWYASAGHCANFMNPGFIHIGFGKGYSASSTYKNYWVADLAKGK